MKKTQKITKKEKGKIKKIYKNKILYYINKMTIMKKNNKDQATKKDPNEVLKNIVFMNPSDDYNENRKKINEAMKFIKKYDKKERYGGEERYKMKFKEYTKKYYDNNKDKFKNYYKKKAHENKLNEYAEKFENDFKPKTMTQLNKALKFLNETMALKYTDEKERDEQCLKFIENMKNICPFWSVEDYEKKKNEFTNKNI